MSSNSGRLGREYIGRNLRIGDKQIIDNKGNLEAVKGQFRGDVRIRGNLVVDGTVNEAPQQVTFPGDSVPMMPDYIICGYGCMGAALAKYLTDDMTTRVLAFEMGADNSNNPLVTQPFSAAPYRGDGSTILNAAGVLGDPTISTFNGAPGGRGDAYSLYPLWTGCGDGGGNQHFLLDYVIPTQVIVDGPTLPSGIIPPNNVSAFPYAVAGANCTIAGAWSYANISNAIKALENFQMITGYGSSVPGASENIAERGISGPLSIMQLAPFPAAGASLDIQTAFSNAANGLNTATPVPGGAACPLVQDYNCNIAFGDSPQHLNCASQNQNYLTNTFLRQGSQTAFMGGSITQSDGNGNLVGVGSRKLVVLNNSTVISPYRSNRSNTTYIAGGVNVLQGNAMLQFSAKNIICALGAGYSPRFWQLGGIGPSALLTKLGIPKQISGSSVEFIGQGVHTQYGPLITMQTTNSAFAFPNFPGQSFVQYRNTPRKWQCVAFSLGDSSIGLLNRESTRTPVPPGQQIYKFNFDGFICNPRSRRGYSNTLASTFRPQLDFNWGFYTDVPNSNFTGTISSQVVTAGTGSAAGSTTLTLSLPATFVTGQVIFGAGGTGSIAPGTYIVTGGTGTSFTMSGGAQTFSGKTITGAPTLVLATPPAVPLLVGQTITGTGVAEGTMIIQIVSGQASVTPGVGPYPTPSSGAIYAVTGFYNGGSNPAPILSPAAMSLDPNDPMSGLSDPDSDMSTSCAFCDFIWETIKQLRLLDVANTYTIASPCNFETVLQVTPAIERWRQLAQIIPFGLSVSAHEQGTLVMGATSATGAVDGNLKLYGTGNCFECSGAIMPIQNSGNPTSLQHAIAAVAGQVIPDVAM